LLTRLLQIRKCRQLINCPAVTGQFDRGLQLRQQRSVMAGAQVDSSSTCMY